MKKIGLLLYVLCVFVTNANAQSVAINADGSTANASSMLDVKSTVKGILIPRLNTTQRLAIATPANGLMVYDVDSLSFSYYNGANWLFLKGINKNTNNWNTTGNTGTIATNFIGTTDAQDLRFKVNNKPYGFFSSSNNNLALGTNSLRVITTGKGNIALGDTALLENTIGYKNTAIGYWSLSSNITGYSNVAVGNNTLRLNTTESNLVAIGDSSLFNNTTGNYNVAVGSKSLYFNTTGYSNTANGYQVLFSNTGGFGNSANGYQALYFNTTGKNNTANGYQTLYSNTIGQLNTANGYKSLYANTDGIRNTAIGSETLDENIQGSDNSAFGTGALTRNLDGNYNTSIGTSTLSNITTLANLNTAVGYAALFSHTGGTNNTAIGANCNLFGMTATDINTIRLGNNQINSIGGQVGWSTLSDGRTKKNILANVQGLAFIKLLKPVTYNYDIEREEALFGMKNSITQKKDKSIEQIKFSGFIAQDVQAAANKIGYDFSGVDKASNGGYLMLRYAEFVVPLVKAVQEQQSQIENLQKEIIDLKKLLQLSLKTNK